MPLNVFRKAGMKEKILKYNAQIPRYTSYPTAPHFMPKTADDYARGLAALPAGTGISAYVHVPFCREMCWYCGCHTTATRKYAPVEDYLTLLHREIRMTAEKAGGRLALSHLHFGGGSPTMLQPDDFRRTMDVLRESFTFLPDAEIAIEADPRGVSHDKAEAYGDCGVNRASFGIQDFSPAVQAAINRRQSFATVEKSVELLRRFGVKGINFDLMYGLPLQTVNDIADTVAQSLSLAPGRIAMFGYAHVPWMKKHMRLIRDEDLPDAAARIDQFSFAESLLRDAGMEPVGLDHFAMLGDSMLDALRRKTLARNFQGYTTDNAAALLGFGVSSISRLPEGFYQNTPHMTEYSAAILAKNLPVAKGRTLDAQDRLRADIIGQLMCYFTADVPAILNQHGRDPDEFSAVMSGLADMAADGLVTIDDGRIHVAEAARQAVRVVASRFDAYFTPQQNKHAQTA